MFFYPFYNPIFFTSMLLLIPGVIAAAYAQHKIKSTYGKFAQVQAASGLTGAQASRQLLDQAGLSDVSIEEVAGNLTDNYDPRARVLHLSQGVARGRSLAALGVAAHETGHALQDAGHYLPMRIRSALVPAANFGSSFGWMIFLMGLFISSFRPLMTVGIVVFTAAVIFQIVTLPVELDASSRAMKLLQTNGIVAGAEADGARQVLRAAALTYVAAALMSILMLVRMIVMSRE
ncbi:MAG: zinc metallopeptidase [Actinobacteria bacterium]|nr:zinc metallopeptidase [Actinomycetota bacterium]